MVYDTQHYDVTNRPFVTCDVLLLAQHCVGLLNLWNQIFIDL